MVFSPKVYLTVRLLLAAVFLYSGMTKIVSPGDFAVVISGYGVLPELLIAPAAIGIPVAEILIAVGLCLDLRGMLALYSGFMVLFMAVLIHGIRMGLDVDCGCFGPDDPEGQAFHSLREALLRDAVILVGCLYLYAVRLVRGIRPAPVRNPFLRFKT